MPHANHRADTDRHVVKSGTQLICICPHCRASLVEGTHLVLDVEREDRENGKLHLSPQLNVFESTSTIDIAEGSVVADLRCSRCGQSLRDAEQRCGECGSRVARIEVDLAGADTPFYICLRKGCHWHDISQAARSRMILEAVGYHRPDHPRELIRSGTKLECSCPHCAADLVQGDDLLLTLESESGDVGTLRLSPRLNDFRSESNVELSRGEVAKDLSCPSCLASVLVANRPCRLCGAPTAKFNVRTSDGIIAFHVCARRQCQWHGLDDQREDLDLEPG